MKRKKHFRNGDPVRGTEREGWTDPISNALKKEEGETVEVIEKSKKKEKKKREIKMTHEKG